MKRAAPPLTHFELFLMEERAVAALDDPTEANLRALWVDHMRLVRDAGDALLARAREDRAARRAYDRGFWFASLPFPVAFAVYGHHLAPLAASERWYFAALALLALVMLARARRRRA